MSKPESQTTNDNRVRFRPDHEYAEQWARDTILGRFEGGHFSTGERNLALAYLALLNEKKEVA